MKILLLDDDPFVLKLLGRQLSNLGLTDVVSHEQPHEALALLEEDIAGIDLVFCDLQMPLMDGVEFLRHLARIGYGGGLVLISGEDHRVLHTVQKLARGHNLDVYGFLRKPVSPELLRSLLNAAFARTARAPRVPPKVYTPAELQRAIAGGELVNFYQPKVDVLSGELAGVETLVRWQHPRDGLVFPDQFIATAEQHGLIDQLTLAVLTDALAQARRWRDSGMALHVAVNVSMDNLAALEFPDVVARAVLAAKVPLTSLVLEVTESRLMSDPLASLEILTRLRLKHIGLSIDDFGTGHSSLVQLRDIPFDELKVDRGFVHGAGKDSSLRAIFEASLGMAQQLGMKTVAEGVEDLDDWHFLRTSSCDLAQGYFIARPMPARDLLAWMAEWEERRGALVAVCP